jgi:hypothetical protein
MTCGFKTMAAVDHAMQERVATLHRHLRLLAQAGEFAPVLEGIERAAMIKDVTDRVPQDTYLVAQVMSALVMLSAQCPGWETDAPGLALSIGSRLDTQHAWVHLPIREPTWH